MAQRLSLFATAARGTEDLLANELTELGAAKVRRDRGGVRFSANLDEALRVCLWTRIAMRVLYPLGEHEAVGAEGLYEAALAVPWEEHLTPDSTFAVEAVVKDSEHRHTGFVALKIKDAIADRLRERHGRRPDVDTRDPDVQVVAHLVRHSLALSLDIAGEPLNRRGYRVRPTVAPLKETLAAAILRVARYTGDEPFLDPMCGSGTLVLEAGLIASRRAPQLERRFSIERWPAFEDKAKQILGPLRAEARAQVRVPPHPLWGLDKDPEALDAARRNARAAHLAEHVRFREADATQPLPADVARAPGLLATNPPYGDRLKAGGQKGMKSFYFKLGEGLQRLEGWRMFVLSGNPAFESAFHLRPTLRRPLWNGAIPCSLLGYEANRAGKRVSTTT